MSIYGSGLVSFEADDHAFGSDDHSWRGKRCERWKRCKATDEWHLATPTAYYRLVPTVDCTCLCGPIAYQQSHVLPADSDPRAGSFDLSIIAGFISLGPDRPALSDDTFPYWPWLRVTVHESDGGDPATVVLDRWQVKQMRDQLTFWLKHSAPSKEKADG